MNKATARLSIYTTLIVWFAIGVYYPIRQHRKKPKSYTYTAYTAKNQYEAKAINKQLWGDAGNGGGKVGVVTMCKVRDGSPRLKGEPPYCDDGHVLSWTTAEKPDSRATHTAPAPCQSAKLYYDGVLVDEEPHCGLLLQPIHQPTALDDLVFAEIPEDQKNTIQKTESE